MTHEDAGRALAAALDRFYYDLRHTAPEMVGIRLNELGALITEPMAVFGYPKQQPDSCAVRQEDRHGA